eukprot:286993-Prymnesium_polylepis.1
MAISKALCRRPEHTRSAQGQRVGWVQKHCADALSTPEARKDGTSTDCVAEPHLRASPPARDEGGGGLERDGACPKVSVSL